MPQKLFSQEKLIHYLETGSRDVQGYLQNGAASLIWSLFDVQDELNITGNIAEIGVYHGKLFVMLCHGLNQGERAFAIDLFDSEPEILGIKTEEDRQRFSADNLIQHLRDNEIGDDIAQLIAANSQKLTSADLLAKFGGANIRLFSIDGDHSFEGVHHELSLAASTLAPEGVVMIDDLFNTLCPSQTEAIIDFFRDDSHDLEPVAIVASNGPITTGAAKLIAARREYAMVYKAYLRLLNRENYKLADNFIGRENVLIFDFQDIPVKHQVDNVVRKAVANFLAES